MHQLHHLDVARVEQTLLPGKEHPPRVEMLVVHLVALIDGDAQGLFAEHVLTRLEGRHSHREVYVERSGYQHGIHLLVLQQLAIVGIYPGLGVHFEGFVYGGPVNVAQSHHLGFRVILQKAHQEASARAGSHHADACLGVARMLHIGKSQQPRAGQQQRTTRRPQVFQKISSVHDWD